MVLLGVLFIAVSGQAAIVLVEHNGCTLADAIRSANADAPRGDCNAGSGTDTIITPDDMYVLLNGTLPTIDSDLTIRTVSAAGQLVIDGDQDHRIMRISGANTDVTLTRLKLTNGHRPSATSNGGGAIRITDATVIINDSEISDSYAMGVNGAGLYIENGFLEINNSHFLNNTLEFGASPFEVHGGGLYAKDSTVDINDSRFFGNLYAWSEPAGSSMYIEGGALHVKRSLIDEERDGILADGAMVTIENSTFGKSPTHQSGYRKDMLYVRNNSSLRLNHVTFGAYGLVAYDSTLDVTNSILRRCFDSSSTWQRDLNNLRLDDACGADRDAQILLRGLGDYGGPTKTHAIDYQSVAVNTGHPDHCLDQDQRGESRGDACDIGSYEVNDVADVAVSLDVVTPMPWGTGQTILINLTLSNQGPGLASLFDLNHAFSGLSIVEVDSFACPDLPCVYPFISAGGQITIPIYARLSSLAGNQFSLTVEAVETINSLHGDPDTSNNIDTVTGSIVAASDLAIHKSLLTPPPYFVGQSVVYVVDVTAEDGLGATGVEVTEYPENLSITNISGCASVSNNVCSINSVSSNFPAQLTVTATVDADFFDNSVTVSATQFDPDLSNNTDDQFNFGATSLADLSVAMSLLTNGPHYSDQFVQYQVTISAGADAATNLLLTSEYPGIYVDVSGCLFLPCELPTIAANQEINLVFSMLAPQMVPGVREDVTHRVMLSAGQADPDLSDNVAAITTALVPAVDLKTNLNLVSDPPFYRGEEVEYHLQVRNRGLNHATDVVVSLPEVHNMTLLWASSQNCDGLHCSVPFLDFDQTEDFVLKMRLTDVGEFDLSAKAVSGDLDPLPGDNVDDSNNGGVTAALPDDLIFADGLEPD